MKKLSQDKWGWITIISFIILFTTLFVKYPGDLIVVILATVSTLIGVHNWNKET